MKKITLYPPRLAALMLLPISSAVFSAPLELVKPHELIVESHTSSEHVTALETVARRYATFWNTGDEALAREALADDFVDKTPRSWLPGPSVPPFRICVVRLSR